MPHSKKKSKVVIVVPTIREASIERFLDEWNQEFSTKNKNFTISLLIVEDNPKKTFNLKRPNMNITHYAWDDIEKEFKNRAWIFPRRTDCVRSYGYFKAYQMNPDMIVTLDDDCYPLKNYMKSESKKSFLMSHWDQLYKKGIYQDDAWHSTIKKLRPRGMPYKVRNRKAHVTSLSHGLWYNVPDFDGQTQLRAKKASGLSGYAIDQYIPKGKYFPMCGMNVAWRPEATPALYFLLMGKDKKDKPWGMDRFGDIWAGILFKKISDHLGHTVSSGDPIIWHDRASDPRVNIKKERNGIKAGEYLWSAIDDVVLTGTDYRTCYEELGQKLDLKGVYWDQLKKAMVIWSKLFT